MVTSTPRSVAWKRACINEFYPPAVQLVYQTSYTFIPAASYKFATSECSKYAYSNPRNKGNKRSTKSGETYKYFLHYEISKAHFTAHP